MKVKSLSIILSLATNISYPAIYGTDDRMSIEMVKDLRLQDVSHAIANRVLFTQLILNYETIQYEIDRSLKYPYELCSEERFAKEQASFGSCTGFLIGNNKLMTAGHCIKDDFNCIQYYWIFDYTNDQQKIISDDNIFTCKRIIKINNDLTTKNDYAIIELDRNTNRAPLKLSLESLNPQTELMSLGFPKGLPMKLARNGFYKGKKTDFSFYHNLDHTHGNSGSPILNMNYEVVGINSAGKEDFTLNKELKCLESNRCDDEGNNCSIEKNILPFETATSIQAEMFCD